MHPHTLAASSVPPGSGYVVLVGLAVVASYAIACLLWPVTACRRCDGAGKFRSPSGRNWRLCRKCKGSGGRIRTGRRIFNFIAAGRRDSR